jgi:hypothetical protein
MTKYIYKLTSFILIISQIFTPLAYAGGITYDDKIAYESEKQIISEVDPYSFFSQTMIEKINKNSEALGVKWVKGGMQSFSKYNFSGFIVLDETLKKLSFFQGNFTYDSKDGKTLNIGLGRRTLVDVSPEFKDFIDSKKVMLEINSFYDLKNSNSNIFSSSSHSRYSLGFKLSTPKYDFYGNLYQRGQSAFMNDERVLNGHDFGVSGRMPKVDNLKINLKRYSFSGDVDRKSGVKLRAEYYLTPHLSFGGEYDNSDQNNSSEELFLNFRYNFGEKLSQKTNNMQSDTAKIWDRRYDEVIRENKVYLEKRLVITTITPPTLSGNLGDTVSVALTSNNGYNSSAMGAVTYAIKDRGNVTGASISGSNLDLSGATITPAASSATIQIRATIAANDQYAEKTINYNVTVNRQSAPSLLFATPAEVAWGTPVSAASAPTSYNEAEMGTLSYAISNVTGISINANTGTVTATQSGTATVTVSTSGTSSKYETGNVGSYTVTFTKQDLTTVSVPSGFAGNAGSVSTVDASLTSNNGYNSNTMGAVTYEIIGNNKGASINSGTGAVNLSSTTATGDITIKATIASNSLYKEKTVEYNFTINAYSQ